MQSFLNSLSQFANDFYDWGSDVYKLNQRLRTSEEIDRLAAALNSLTEAFGAGNAAAKRLTVSWGTHPQPRHNAAPETVTVQSSDPTLCATAKPSAPETLLEDPVSPPATVNPAIYFSAIGLADWLQRTGEDDRILPAQGLTVATKKTNELLRQLELIRLDASGQFDIETQEIVDVVATEAAALDRTVAATVLPGYKLGEKLIRPQKVQIYRYNVIRPARNQTRNPST